tara:strand:+ start:577 stop:936 length:360 start_codon:yes stop_codon:yes gene_type:complete
MSFKTLINSNVTNAFSLVGDLATNVQFTNVTVTGYDFGNQTVNSTAIAPITIKGIITNSYRTNDNDKPRINADIILKSSDIDSKVLDNYDSVIFGGNTYAINKYDDNGFIINITVGREA